MAREGHGYHRSPMLTLIPDLATFLLLIPGGALLWASWLRHRRPAEAFALGLGGSLLAIFFVGLGIHIQSLPRLLWLVLPTAIAGGLWWRRSEVAAVARDAELRALGLAWIIFAAWSLGLLGLVVVYSGGGWAGDWVEHFERANFFLSGGGPNQKFYRGYYTLSARPPLANVVTSALMYLSGRTFADYQVFTTLLSTLILFPTWLLAARWMPRAGASSPFVVCVLLMLNPMVAQNLTFAWTKLPAAFWILLGTYFLLGGFTAAGDAPARRIGFACLAAAMVTHYSAGPWILVALGAYVVHGRSRLRSRDFWKETAAHALTALLILGPWAFWISAREGVVSALTQNTSAQAAVGKSLLTQAEITALNIRDTLIPLPFRNVDTSLLNQSSRLGRLRDDFFNFYQLSLVSALGVGSVISIGLLFAGSPRPPSRRDLPWAVTVASVIVAGVAVHTQRDPRGLAHICLQPLVHIGLAWLAARLNDASRGVRLGWAFGAAIDLLLGIVLHYGLQALWFAPLQDLNVYARFMNYPDLLQNRLIPLAARLAQPIPLIPVLLGLLLISALFRAFAPDRTGDGAHAIHSGIRPPG